MPALTNVTVFPETVQTATVVEVKVTVKLELAVAPMVNGAAPMVLSASAAKVLVCDAGFTVKVRVTGGAGSFVASPGWLAVIEQEPPLRIVAVLPETVQMVGVFEAKVTGSPEVAVALSVICAEGLYVMLGSGLKVIVCEPGTTLKVRVTAGAAAKLVLPAWFAVIEHAPRFRIVTALPATVHTVGVEVVKATSRPEVEVAAIWIVPIPSG